MLAPALSATTTSDKPCSEMTYENRNQVDYGPLRIHHRNGIVIDPDGVRIPSACMGIFSEADHRLVSSTHSNKKGDFEIRNLPDGNYRLVAKYDGFCAANARINVTAVKRKTGRLIVHVRPGGVDDCSYIEFK